MDIDIILEPDVTPNELKELALRLHDDPADAIEMIGEHVVSAMQ